MRDKNREAFEAFISKQYGWNDFRQDGPGYFNVEVDDAYDLWQAARDHYGPKLTENESVEKAARALAEIDCASQAILRKVFNEPPVDEVRCVNKNVNSYIHEAKAALRAAGVQFKDEA